MSYLFFNFPLKSLKIFSRKKIPTNTIIAIIIVTKKFNKSLKLNPNPVKNSLNLILTLKNPHNIKLPITPSEAAVIPIFDFFKTHIIPIKAKVNIIKINFQSKIAKLILLKIFPLLFYFINFSIITPIV